MWLMENDAKNLKNDWNPDKWVLIWRNSVRAIQWIPTWQGFICFLKIYASLCLDKSSLSIIERVNSPSTTHAVIASFLRLFWPRINLAEWVQWAENLSMLNCLSLDLTDREKIVGRSRYLASKGHSKVSKSQFVFWNFVYCHLVCHIRRSSD